jgi:hypothetical protein
MNVLKKCLGGFIFAGFLGLMAMATLSQQATSKSAREIATMQADTDEQVPAYHAEKPEGPLPSTVRADLFTDPVVRNAYTVAARIKKVLYQMPCYCHCDRSQGHGSLLDCFASKHGAGCQICVREDLYAYEQGRKGKTPAQIREGIKKGEWQTVDLAKYEKPLPVDR